MSIRLHQSPQLYLMSHSDCATYGGLQAFGGDTKREMDHHRQELQRAAELVKQHFPELMLRRFFVDFEGIYSAGQSDVEEVA